LDACNEEKRQRCSWPVVAAVVYVLQQRWQRHPIEQPFGKNHSDLSLHCWNHCTGMKSCSQSGRFAGLFD